MSGTFRISVSKDYLVFASAHFITFRGHHCEALHGHNYRVGVTVEGAVDPESYFVLDFSVLKQTVRRLVDEIDHRVLLPTRNPKLAIEQRDGRVSVALHGTPTYVFPVRDCAMLPIENTTVELLARWLHGLVHESLVRDGHAAGLTALEIEVEEGPGQGATYRRTFAPAGA